MKHGLSNGWELTNIPSMRGCGLKLDMQHVLSCKQGGFTTRRHNNVLDSAGSLLPIICKDVDIERKLLHITGEAFDYPTVTTSNKARIDIRATGFWERGQQAFFDVRLFNSNPNRYLETTLPQCYIQNEKEKKRKTIEPYKLSTVALLYSYSRYMAG